MKRSLPDEGRAVVSSLCLPTRHILRESIAHICHFKDTRPYSLLLRAEVLALPIMASAGPSRINASKRLGFDAQAFLDSAGVSRKIVEYPKKTTIFAQGDSAAAVMYIQQGRVKLTVVNGVGKEAVVAVLGPGDFFGEGQQPRCQVRDERPAARNGDESDGHYEHQQRHNQNVGR